MLSLRYALLNEVAYFLEKIEFQLLFWTQLLVVRRLLAARILPPNIRYIAGKIREIVCAVLLLIAEYLTRDIL